MTGDYLDGMVCPKCYGKIINDGFDDFNTLLLNCHCEDCDWEGNENDAIDEEEIPYDRNGNIIKTGDKVWWYDPETGKRSKYQYEVFGKPMAEMVKLTSKYGECEAYSSECVIAN